MTIQTTNQVAAEMNIPEVTLKKWIASGKFQPPQKPGDKYYAWLPEDKQRLRDFMAARGYVPGGSNAGRPRKQAR